MAETTSRNVSGYVAESPPSSITSRNIAGYVAEADISEIDIFSLQGIVIEKSPALARVGRTRLLVSQDTHSKSKLERVRLLVSQTSNGFINMVTDMSPLDQFKRIVQLKSTVTRNWANLEIGKPRHDGSNNPARTEVDISALEASTYRGVQKVTYSRRPINMLSGLDLNPADFNTVAEVIASIRSRGYLVDGDDIDLAESTVGGGNITLVAAPESYIFYPGSILVIGGDPPMSAVFDVRQLTGFQPEA